MKRLEDIFEGLDFQPGGRKCAGMEGLIKEGSDMISEDAPAAVKDAGLISAAQRIEHYEIAGILQETLNEEALADQKLTRLAVRRINFEALTG